MQTRNHENSHYKRKAEARRRSAMAKIHIGKKQLGLNDETYRAMLLTLGGVKSSKDLTTEGINAVIRHMEKSGVSFTTPKKSGRKPHNLPSTSERAPKLQKIEALLAEAGRPWEYALSLAKRMYNKSALEFCGHDQLTGIIAALQNDAIRHGRSLG